MARWGSEVGLDALHGRVGQPRREEGEALVQGSVDAADAHGDDLEARLSSVVEAQYLEGLLVSLRGVARSHGQGRLFPVRPLRQAAVDSRGAGDRDAPDLEDARGLQDVDEPRHVGPVVLPSRVHPPPRHRQVDDARYLVRPHSVHHVVGARDVHPLRKHPAAPLLLQELRLPHGVEARQHHLFTGVQELTRRVQANESHPAGYQYHPLPFPRCRCSAGCRRPRWGRSRELISQGARSLGSPLSSREWTGRRRLGDGLDLIVPACMIASCVFFRKSEAGGGQNGRLFFEGWRPPWLRCGVEEMIARG